MTRAWRAPFASLALAIFLVAVPQLAFGQVSPGSEPADPQGRSLDDFDPFPAPPDPGKASPETTQAYQAALGAYFAYRKAGYEHRLRVFEWQSLSTKIIFFVVLLLVLAGIGFAAIQFHTGLRERAEGEAGPSEETEISLSLREVKVRSPVLGVIILALSLAFFYLYLVYIYPIRNVF